MALVAVACATLPEALALFCHLAWWVLDEAEYASGHQPAYDIAMARAKDLSLYLGTFTGPARIPQAMPSGRLAARLPRRAVPMIDLRPRTALDAPEDEDAPGSIVGWEAVTPVRPDTAHVRALRFLDLTGEALAAYAMTWTGRCKVQGSGGDLNAAGRLMQWIGDALTDVETAAINEARSRDPARDDDRAIRLDILARSIIQGGAPAETAAFARELLAFAEH